MKLQAGSLVYALLILLMVSGTVSSFILSAFFSRQHIEHDLSLMEVDLDLKSGIQYLLSENQPIQTNGFLSITLFNKHKSLEVATEPYGVFALASAKTHLGDNALQKSALLGSAAGQLSQLALYLTDQHKPLSLCGPTEIIGMVRLPKAGVKRAYIEGQHFSGTYPTINKNQYSDVVLPPMNEQTIREVYSRMTGPLENDSLLNPEVLNENRLTTPWHAKTTYVSIPHSLQLTHQTLQGRMVIRSAVDVEVSDCHLDGIIVIGRKITIGSRVTGNAQFFASDSIILSEQSMLTYPSVLGLFAPETSRNHSPAIVVKNGSSFEGELLMYEKNIQYKHALICQVGSQAIVTGTVYVRGKIDLKGRVNGSVYCREFYLKTPSSIYVNHLLGGKINRTNLPSNFVNGFALNNRQKEIIRWLN